MDKAKKTMSQKELESLIQVSVQDGLAEVTKTIEELKSQTSSITSVPVVTAKEDNSLNQSRILKAQIAYERSRMNGEMGSAKTQAEFVNDYIAEKYSKTDPAFVARVAETAKDLLASGNGGNLIVEEYAQGFLDQLWDQTILDKLGVNFLPTESGNLNFNKIIEGVSAGYVPETGMIDTSTLRFGTIRLSVKKLMALVPISNDMIRMSNVSVDNLVGDQITREMAAAINYAFIYGKGTAYEPRGIFNIEGINKYAAGVATVPTFNVGLEMIATYLKHNMSKDGAHWVMGVDTHTALLKEVQTSVGRANYDELSKGFWHGLPVIVTNIVKSDSEGQDLFLINSRSVVGIQKLAVTLDQSSTASFMTADGMISAFHGDYTVIRAIAEHDFGLTNKAAVVYCKAKV